MSEETIDVIEVKIPYPKSKEESERRYYCHASIKRYIYYPERFNLIKAHYLTYLQRQIERQEWIAEKRDKNEAAYYNNIADDIKIYAKKADKTKDLNELLALTPDSQILRERHFVIDGISLIKAIK